VNADRKTVCLSMIVKNEAPVIRRCLDSVRSIIDYWVIVDTGSTDGTQDIIRNHLKDLPGELHERPWQDFARNRSEALAIARPHGDYSLIIDGDDALEIPERFRLPNLAADSYVLDIQDSSIRYQRTQLVRNALAWRYAGVLHEFLTCEGAGPAGYLPIVMRRNHDGARRRDPDTYRKDAGILESALATEADPFLVSRYTFYLAQSYRDCGEREKALDSYLKRAELGYWNEEIYISLLEAGNLMAALDRPLDEVIATYERAAQVVPARAEALHAASRHCRKNSKFAAGYEYARRGLGIAAPGGGLFVQPWVYDYGLLDELAVNAYWIEQYQDCLDACQRLIREGKMPEDMYDRVKKNMDFATEKIRGKNARAQASNDPVVERRFHWVPTVCSAGTELMVAGLRERMGADLDRINLQVNHPGHDKADKRPRVVWMHHDANQTWVQWCKDKELVDTVSCFVFVSYWHRERYLNSFGLPPGRCVVLRHALDLSEDARSWEAGPIWRCAYTSTPFRGLSVLLDAWQRLGPADAELHIWSSMKLYLEDDGPYQHLYERAEAMPGVIYHGIAPNPELRAALRSMHFLVYPCTFAETACLAVIEAMAAGCRVIVPSLGALPETTGGYARIYPSSPNAEEHAGVFAKTLADEFASPWVGEPGLSLSQQAHCANVYDWPRRLIEWRQLIQWTCDQRS
jgi:glycosyltransferase involved in cell wall biosynthesis